MNVFETNEDREAAETKRRDEERAWRIALRDMKAGAYVVERSGYGGGKTVHVRRVLKITKTQIVTDSYSESPLRFSKEDGYEVGRDRYRSQLVALATTAQAMEHERQRQERAEKAAENIRLSELCQRATDKLKTILGDGVKVMRWTTREDGTVVYKVEAENLTEAQVATIAQRTDA